MSSYDRVGKRIGNFSVTKYQWIPELLCPLVELQHEPTGARVMHLPTEDPENLFCLSFQTLPSSSNGVAHIVEHTVLCGSKKFPIKDPFFCMQRRSLHTFMNALTGADFTCYPAATQVKQDFYNLLEVYLDAVFAPNLTKMSFLQEGHRLEFSVPDNPSSPLDRKGVVYNEMKGVMASPNSRLHEVMNHYLFPNITYGCNSGGDPKEIPHLTYDELLEFHQKFYHPSRCLFFFYGNLPLEEHLSFLENQVLQQTKPVSQLPPLDKQTRFSAPVRHVAYYPIGDEEEEEEKAFIAFGWLTCDIHDQEEALALSMLEIILTDTDASPLKRALQHSGLCKQATAFLEEDMSELPWVITCKGCDPESADALETFLLQTLQKIADEGLPLAAIEMALHQLEIQRSEIVGDHYPFGLVLFMHSALLKQHGVDPESGLTLHTHFQHVRERLRENPQYFSELLQRYLIDNPHRVRIVLCPDKKLIEREEEEERVILEKLREELTEEEKKNLVFQAGHLAKHQQEIEGSSIEILPKIHLSDVPAESRRFELRKEERDRLTIYHHPTFTNGLTYAELHFPLHHVSKEELSYLPLFASLLTQMGSGGRTYIQTLEYMQAHTGGIGSTLSLHTHVEDHTRYTPSFVLRGKALDRKISFLFPLLLDTLQGTAWNDRERLKELIQKQATVMESRINQLAMRYAVQLSSSALNQASWLAHQWYGIPYLHFLLDLSTHLDTRLDSLVDILSSLHKKLLSVEKGDLVITCQEDTYRKIVESDFYQLSAFPKGRGDPWQVKETFSPMVSQGRKISSAVAFTAKVLETVSYVHPASTALSLASFLFDNTVLHPKIREQGGAYGGGSAANALGGTFYFYAYRDPHIHATLEAFDTAVTAIRKGSFTDEQLEEAKLEMIQAIDSPVAPGSRGALAYQWLQEGKTFEFRQRFRQQLLAIQRQEIVDAVEKHIVPKMDEGAAVVFASEELFNQENTIREKEGKAPLPLFPVME